MKIGEIYRIANNGKSGGTIYDKASSIVIWLGKEWKEDRHWRNQYYDNMEYEGYGFRIVQYDIERNRGKDGRNLITIDYKGRRVFDDEVFAHGAWEEALNELYISIPAILDQRAEEKALLDKKEAIVDVLVRYPEEDGGTYIKGSDGKIVRVCKSDNYGGSYDCTYLGTEYYVHVDGELVFDAYRSRSIDNNPTKHKVYVPGSWEQTIRQGVKSAQDSANQRKQQKEEEEANEIIKLLRKLRGKN